MNSDDANPNAKLGSVIAMVVYYREQKEFDMALAQGKIGLALQKTHPGLRGKLESMLKSIEEQKNQ